MVALFARPPSVREWPSYRNGTPNAGASTESKAGERMRNLVAEGSDMKRHVASLSFMVAAVVAASLAWAEPKDDVAATTAAWAQVFAQNDPDKIAALYSKDGVLWGTLSPTVRSDPAAIRAYFVNAFAALPQAKVSFGDQLIRVYGNAAINTGYYTFSYNQGRRDKDHSGALQLHLCEGRRQVDDR